MIDTTLGHFRIVAKLSESRSGEVYRAEDEALRRPVALEVLAPALASDPERRARFLSAARAAAAVTHPSLAAIHEVGESDGRVWVAMELVEGASLRTRLRGRPLPLLETLKIGEQVAEGLAAAHEAGLAHGGLRPERVLLGPGGQVKVVGLGPGDEESSEPYDTRTDVYRLGAMLYEMATGRAPQIAQPAGAVTTGTEGAAATIPVSTLNPEAPAELDRIIATCLEPDPEDRYQQGGPLAVDLGKLRRWTESAPVVVPSGAISIGPEVRRRWARRWLWAAASLALVAAAGLAGWWAWRLFRPAPPFKAGDRYIVADFVNETSDIVLGIALRGLMEELGSYVTLVAVSRWGEKEVTALDAAAAAARCLQGECEGYISGRLAGDPEHYRLEIALRRVGRSEPVVALASETDAKRIGHDMDGMVKDAARILQRWPGLGKPPEDTANLCTVWSGDANGLKAYHAMPAGPDFEHPEASLAAYRNAVELDPNNPSAHWMLGWIKFQVLGLRREALPHLREAVRLMTAAADTRPECRWNALTDEVWYLDWAWGYDALAERVNRGVQMFPNHAGMLLKYAEITERMMGDPAASLAYYRKAYQIAERSFPAGFFDVLGMALLRAGKVDEIDPLLDDYRRRTGASSSAPTVRSSIELVSIAQALGRGDDYLAILAMIERQTGEGEPSKAARDWQADLLAAAGKLAEAENRDREASTGRSSTAAMSGTQVSGGYRRLDWLVRRRTGKVRDLEPADQDSYLQSDHSLNDLARMSVELGTARALGEVLRIVEEEQKDNRNYRVQEAIRFGNGCQALVDGRSAEAVELLEPLGRDYGPSSILGPQRVLARAYEAAGRWADAARTYESLLAERRFWLFRPEPIAAYVLDQHRLAGIYDRLGNSERARYWYGRFLNDWRNADPGMPEVEDAKRRLAALGGPLPAGAS